MRRKCSYYGSPWLGMFIATNDKISIIPDDSMEKVETFVCEHLKTDVVRLNVGESNLIGLYIAMNKNGIILPNIATDQEVSEFKKLGLNVYHSKEKQNAHGNNISLNDKGGIINPNISGAERKRMEDVLGIELLPMKIARYVTLGSTVLSNNKGFLSHFATTDSEIKDISDALKVGGEKGSINMGVGFVALGALCNKSGYIVGEQTSAHEMGRIESALGYLD
jgi:translation initiation factor 6